MATTIPVPIEFELPDGWIAAPPDEVGAPGTAFVALRPDAGNGFTPNITVGGEFRSDQASLADIADDSVTALAAIAVDATASGRSEFGGDASTAPGLTQLVRVRYQADKGERELTQCQVYLSLHDIDDESRRVVLQLALTASADRIGEVIDDFQRFVASVRPEVK